MNVIRRPDWHLPESAATPEAVFLEPARRDRGGRRRRGRARRRSGRGPARRSGAGPERRALSRPRSPAFATLDRPLTSEQIATTYNNFYEFGTSKQIWRAAQALRIRPWQIRIEGLVERPFTIGVDDLLRQVELEERLYRFRCVEAWAMAVPWTGFPMARLLEIAKPTSAARYVRFDTFHDATMAPGQRQFWYPWPYVEGLTMAEAAHPLSMMVTGAYGKPLPRQMGAPIRMMVPWKYGFKSGKSINRSCSRPSGRRPSGWRRGRTSTASGPTSTRRSPTALEPGERAHDRDRRDAPTLIYNGYGDQVASLYSGLPRGERLYM